MHYFEIGEKYIKKYDVTFNKEQINNLKNTIINECSIVKHIEIDDEVAPNFDKLIIINYKKIILDRRKLY